MLIKVLDNSDSHNVVINTTVWVMADELDDFQEGAATAEKGITYSFYRTGAEPGADLDRNCGFAWSRRFLHCKIFFWNGYFEGDIKKVN